jgi:hypothetical protein
MDARIIIVVTKAMKISNRNASSAATLPSLRRQSRTPHSVTNVTIGGMKQVERYKRVRTRGVMDLESAT